MAVDEKSASVITVVNPNGFVVGKVVTFMASSGRDYARVTSASAISLTVQMMTRREIRRYRVGLFVAGVLRRCRRIYWDTRAVWFAHGRAAR